MLSVSIICQFLLPLSVFCNVYFWNALFVNIKGVDNIMSPDNSDVINVYNTSKRVHHGHNRRN